MTLYTEHMYCLCAVDISVKLEESFERTWGFQVWLLTEGQSY